MRPMNRMQCAAAILLLTLLRPALAAEPPPLVPGATPTPEQAAAQAAEHANRAGVGRLGE